MTVAMNLSTFAMVVQFTFIISHRLILVEAVTAVTTVTTVVTMATAV